MECDGVGSTAEALQMDAITGLNLWWLALQKKRDEINFPNILEDPKGGTSRKPAGWRIKLAAIVLILKSNRKMEKIKIPIALLAM